MLQHCVSSSCTWGKWGRHAHGWSAAPHGPTLCGLCPTSDSGGSWPRCAQLTFSDLLSIDNLFFFNINNVELQEETANTSKLHHRFIRKSCFFMHHPRYSLSIDQAILFMTLFVHLLMHAAFSVSNRVFYLLSNSVKWALSTYAAPEPLPCPYLAERDSHTPFLREKNQSILRFCTVLTEISVAKPVRSFTLMRIYRQTHKYHILLTFICWQTDLKYRSTISVIIT